MASRIWQAIETKWQGPTDRRGSRVLARADAAKLTVQWDHALNVQDNHRAAAEALARKLGWHTPDTSMEGGAMRNGYVWVFVDRRPGC